MIRIHVMLLAIYLLLAGILLEMPDSSLVPLLSVFIVIWSMFIEEDKP